jgi:hypothetical protein
VFGPNQKQLCESHTTAGFAGTSQTTNSRFIASRIRKRDVKIAIRFDFHSDDEASKSEPFVFNSSPL